MFVLPLPRWAYRWMKRETLPSERGTRGEKNNTLESELISPAGKHFWWSSKTQRKNKKCWFGVFRHPNYLRVMSCESPAVVKRENETTELPHLSGAVGRASIPMGTLMGPVSRPPPKPFFGGELRNEKEEALKWRALLAQFSRPSSTLLALRTSAQMFSVQDEHEPSAQSESSDSSRRGTHVSAVISPQVSWSP